MFICMGNMCMLCVYVVWGCVRWKCVVMCEVYICECVMVCVDVYV